jgi:hypothetical protein
LNLPLHDRRQPRFPFLQPPFPFQYLRPHRSCNRSRFHRSPRCLPLWIKQSNRIKKRNLRKESPPISTSSSSVNIECSHRFFRKAQFTQARAPAAFCGTQEISAVLQASQGIMNPTIVIESFLLFSSLTFYQDTGKEEEKITAYLLLLKPNGLLSAFSQHSLPHAFPDSHAMISAADPHSLLQLHSQPFDKKQDSSLKVPSYHHLGQSLRRAQEYSRGYCNGLDSSGSQPSKSRLLWPRLVSIPPDCQCNLSQLLSAVWPFVSIPISALLLYKKMVLSSSSSFVVFPQS